MNQNSFRIKVPGSTSNIGPGFDSIGIALNLYLTLECFPSKKWEFVQKSNGYEHLPSGKENMIYQVAEKVAKHYGVHSLPPYRVHVHSEIPLARGLGSSGAVTVAGLELANQILKLNLSLEEKITLAAKLEGHPDNATPSILGGCVVAYFKEDQIYYVNKKSMKVDFIAMIPRFELSTKKAREALPKELDYFQGIEGSAIGNVCTAAIFQGDYELLGEVMEKEVFHQPYRKKFISHFDEWVNFMKDEGAYGTFLSGAGPTMISICEAGLINESRIKKWGSIFPNVDWKVLQVEEHGLAVSVLEPTVEK